MFYVESLILFLFRLDLLLCFCFSSVLNVVHLAHYAPNIFWNFFLRFESDQSAILDQLMPASSYKVAQQRTRRIRRSISTPFLTYSQEKSFSKQQRRSSYGSQLTHEEDGAAVGGEDRRPLSSRGSTAPSNADLSSLTSKAAL